MMTKKDLLLLEQKGITEATVNDQIERFVSGFKPLEVLRPATLDDGILSLNPDNLHSHIETYKQARSGGLRLSKFVPASGAATRMFKDLYQYLEEPVALRGLPYDHPIVRFCEQLPRFAFFPLLVEKLRAFNLSNVHVRKSRASAIISALLSEEGLNYGFLPKGLVHFHAYPDALRTAMEEHLVEGSRFALGSDGLVNIHFTISPEHEALFKEQLYAHGPEIENQFESGLNVTFSFQKSHTDTLAVSPDNQPFRDDKSQLLFRPGGHGALIENLNEQESEIIFIKNIDNVVPLHLLQSTIDYKMALGGLLLALRDEVFGYLHALDAGGGPTLIERISKFIKERFFAQMPPAFIQSSQEEQAAYLHSYLNRPIRVCGMVRNEGEPGGGPFWIREASGQESLQILESSQLNPRDPHQAAQLKAATHFNPVDLVCSVYDYKGKKFNLNRFTDPETGFVSEKSYNGRPLKALELPGLWNGAMANWLTLFAEVPIETFNPVKTVNDLLRPQHQPE